MVNDNFKIGQELHIALFRIDERFKAEIYCGYGLWKNTVDSSVLEAYLGIDWVTAYDRTTHEEAEEYMKKIDSVTDVKSN